MLVSLTYHITRGKRSEDGNGEGSMPKGRKLEPERKGKRAGEGGKEGKRRGERGQEKGEEGRRRGEIDRRERDRE